MNEFRGGLQLGELAAKRCANAGVLCLLVGGALRYFDIRHQLLLDDEWHSLGRIGYESLRTLATTHFPLATTIPLNIYNGVLLRTVGLNETLMRGPTILATLATLYFVPEAFARLYRSASLGLTLGALTALSPFLIFYGQSARPYAPYLLLSLLSIYYLHQGLRSQDALPWIKFACAGALAAYFHLFAIPMIAALAFPAAAYWLWTAGKPERPRLALMLAGFSLCALLTLALYAFPLMNDLAHRLPTGQDRANCFTYGFFGRCFEFLAGTPSAASKTVMGILAAAGIVRCFRSNGLFSALLLGGCAGTLLFTFWTHPVECYVPIVLLRYNILTPILLLTWVAAGFAWGTETLYGAYRSLHLERPSAASFTALAGAGALLLYGGSSPLPARLSLAPYNFRLHSAFQENVHGMNWERPYESDFYGSTIHRSSLDVPAFYRKARRGEAPCIIVEYPTIIPDHENPYYFYQFYHRCRVMTAFTLDDVIGQFLGARRNRDGLRFTNMMVLDGRRAVPGSGDRFLVIHRDIRAEIGHEVWGAASAVEVQALMAEYGKLYGPAVYSDAWITVYSPDPRHSARGHS